MEYNMNEQVRDDKPLKEEEVSSKDHFKKIYLISYNLSQVAGFLYVIAVIVIRYSKLGYESFTSTFEHLGPTVKFLHIMQLLETLHPIIGLTKGGPVVPFVQLLGRLFICFVMFDCEPKMASNPAVAYLFIVWSTIEIIRHLFYYTQLRKIDYPLLTFIRYTAWIPLYPMGISGESYVMVTNIQHFQESQRFTVSMPNDWNWTFNMPMGLKIQTFVLCGPVAMLLMGHMYKMMKRKLRKEATKPKVN